MPAHFQVEVFEGRLETDELSNLDARADEVGEKGDGIGAGRKDEQVFAGTGRGLVSSGDGLGFFPIGFGAELDAMKLSLATETASAAFVDFLAGLENGDAVTDLLDFGEQVRAEQDGHPGFFAELEELFAELDDALGIEPVGSSRISTFGFGSKAWARASRCRMPWL